MSYLAGKRVYLSCPMEHAKDLEWSGKLKEFLHNFKVEIFDPVTDPKQQWLPKLQTMRASGDYNGMHEVASKFVRKDLSLVDRADFLIAYLPWGVPTTGVVHEIVVATNAKKPTILICPEGKEKISLWYYGFVNHNYMFGNWVDLFQYLGDVSDGKHMEDDRWAFVYGLI